MKRVLLCQAVVPLALVACASAQTVSTQGQTATPIVPEFLQTFDSAHELDATAWTASASENATRAHSPSNVTVKDGVLALKLSASVPGTKPVCAEIASRRNDFFYGTLNHWSSNIPTWGGKAPKEDAVMLVDWVYFSSEYKAPPSKFLSGTVAAPK